MPKTVSTNFLHTAKINDLLLTVLMSSFANTVPATGNELPDLNLTSAPSNEDLYPEEVLDLSNGGNEIARIYQVKQYDFCNLRNTHFFCSQFNGIDDGSNSATLVLPQLYQKPDTQD